MKNTKTIFIGLFFIIFLSLMAFLSFYIEKGYPGSEVYEMPNILLIDKLGLQEMNYDEDLKEYEVESFYEPEKEPLGPLQIELTDDFVFIRRGASIVRLNADMEIEKEVYIQEMGRMETTKDNLFVSTKNGNFISFNEDLEELSSVKLNNKYAHDFIIHEDVAYLLDNIMFPIYIFKVDVKNPNNIEIMKRIEISGINHHLSTHWINPELDRWMVVQTQSTRGGGWSSVIFYSMSKARKVNVENIFSNTFDNNWEGEGYNIVTVTELPPTWSVIAKDNNYYLAHISIENDVLSETIYLDLGEYEYSSSNFIIKKHGNYLFLAYKKKMQVFDISNEPELVLTHNTSHNIIDFIFSK